MKTPVFFIAMALIGLALLFVLSNAFYRVYETEQVIVTQFGEPVGDPQTDAGLHFKLPFIQKVNRLEKRVLEWDGAPNQIPTKDKLFIQVDTYGRWRISDPLLYFQRLRNEMSAQSRLDDILDGETRNAIAQHELLEIIRSTNREAQVDEALTERGEPVTSLQSIQVGRARIAEEILERSSVRLTDLGIELLDIRFKRINYNEDVRTKIYERMISERLKIADEFRSEGMGEAARIHGERERELKRIESEAYKKVQEIRGVGDARATEIYTGAYNQSAQAYEFYEFMKTMETYIVTLDSSTMAILSTKSDFLKFLKGIDPDESLDGNPFGVEASNDPTR